ncbi:MAG: restriction endonuclease subunit S [Acutalibacteraceae bacterium]|nr:restriction endonuclease subunit S [Acutalibacteraceae bacterium]
MALTKCKLGDLIEKLDNKNDDLKYGVEYALGVSNNKELMPTKADLNGRDLAKFSVVHPGDFVYNHRTSRHGDKFCIAYNTTDEDVICTEDYTVFRIRDDCKSKILNEWLYMFFHRPEMDRFIMYSSWGSSTEFFNWDDVCDVDIDLPPLPIQQKYVDIYTAMVINQQSYERGLEDLKLVCDGYIEDLRRKMPSEKIGPYIKQSDKNKEGKINFVLGIGQSGFIKPQKEPNESLKNYKTLKNGMIGYAPPLYNMLSGAIHYYDGSETAVCSPIYEVFECTNGLLPEYLILWLKREEFKRYAEYFSAGVRGTFEFEFMGDVEIPIPDVKNQKAIADIYNIYITRKRFNEILKKQIKDICPILIKGSIVNGG